MIQKKKKNMEEIQYILEAKYYENVRKCKKKDVYASTIGI